MSNYWNKLSPLHGTVTKRQSHATGGIAFKAGSDRAKSVKEKEKKNNRKRKKFETPYHGRWSVSKETFEEAKKDVGDIKGKAHHLKAHKEEGKKRLNKIKNKSDYSPFYSEKVLKSAFPDRDKGWGGKHSRKIEHNAKGGRVGLKDGKSVKATEGASINIDVKSEKYLNYLRKNISRGKQKADKILKDPKYAKKVQKIWDDRKAKKDTKSVADVRAGGGRVGLKQGGKPVKTLVAGFVGKAKDWPGAKAVKKLNKKGRTRK